MAASRVVSTNLEPLPELWAVLGKARCPPTERAAAYQALAGSLKGEVSPNFINTLTSHYQKIIKLIIDDIGARTCAQEAIQLLGYCLFIPQFAEACGDEAGNIIGALCSVQYKKPTEKSILTRALWCLSSQNFHSYQVCHSVPQVITLATEIILEYGFSSLAVESLNVFRRVHQQCPKEFGLVVSMWYKGIIVLLYCKIAKFQRKAHSFAIMFESSIASNNYLVGYLCKELKEKVIGAMLGYMEERGKDPILIMNIWSHFVTVLGNSLHKHSSFLNEMLRVVEMGFKHKVFLVQVAAYSAWKVLINNFSLEMDRLTQQRRLKLLLMPLLASAVKDKHEQVETARLLTWWHLIKKLGPHRESLFQQVCVPFLLFCLGVDPKLELSKLPSVLADLGSWTQPLANGPSHPPSEKHSSNQNKENVPSSGCPTGQGKAAAGSGQGFSSRAGRLLTLLSSSSPGKKSDRYQNTPKLGLVMSGCHAVLQFVGCEDTLHGSLLDTDGGNCVVYQKNAVPFNVIQFLTVFLDGALLYMVHYAKEVKENSVESLVKALFPIILGTIKRESVTDAKAAGHLVSLLTSMLKWEAVTTNVPSSTRMDLLSQLVTLPSPLTSAITATHGPLYWCSVAHELMSLAPTEYNHPKFQSSWGKLVEVSTSPSGGAAHLAVFSELCGLLDRFVAVAVPVSARKPLSQPSSTLHRMWTSLAQRLVGVVKETSQVNEGTSLDPNFATVRHILKFPFLHHTFYSTEKLMMNAMFETWKEIYDTFCIHCSLVVKDPNHCAELVCKDIYECYGQNVRGDSTTLDKSETVTFDSYQNTVGQALTHVLSKFNWGPLRTSVVGEGVGGRGGERGGKTLQPLISVLSWQLATLWDTVQRSPMQIVQLASPYTVMEAVTQLYSQLPTRDLIHTTTEMLAQPMVTLWQNVLDSEAKPPTGSHKSLHKGPFDLPERVIKTWRAILTCIQNRYSAPFTSDLLDALSPLLVLCLSSRRQEVVGETLTFWCATFDSASEPLVYPNKLRDVFVKFRKKGDVPLKLPGFEVTSGGVAHSTTMEDSLSLPDSAVSRHPLPSSSTSSSDNPNPCNTGVVLPHPSPQKGVRGSFLGQKRSPRPGGVPTTPPRSPAAQDMEEILARSRGRGGRGGTAAVGKSPALSARRRLSLNSDKSDDYVLVEPPAKRQQQILTDHQREKMRERRESIPVMYNALDPSQDPTPSTSHPSLPDSAPDEPIIIPESEGSPPATVTTRSIFPTTTISEPRPTPHPGPSSSSSSLVQGPPSSSSLVQGPPSSTIALASSQTVSNASLVINPATAASTGSLSVSSVEATQMFVGVAQGQVRKSPISSRTRSRVRPEGFSIVPSGNGTPYPIPPNHPPPPYYTVSHSYVARLAYHSLPPSPTLPPSPHLPSPTGIPSPFSPTDQHYHSQPGFPRSAEQQHVYQFVKNSAGLPVMMPVPLRQPVITDAQSSSSSSGSGAQFVPVVPQSIGAAPLAPTSIQPGASSQQNSTPTFPPARYIFRPTTNPPPYSLHSPPVQQDPRIPTHPLPLSAVVLPDFAAARRANKRRSSSLSSQQSLPPASGTPTPETGSVRMVRGSVDAPIVIEDVEEPRTTMREPGKTRSEVSVIKSSSGSSELVNQIVISSETNEEGQSSSVAEVKETEPVSTAGDAASEVRKETQEAQSAAGEGMHGTGETETTSETRRQESTEHQQEEDMEVVSGKTDMEVDSGKTEGDKCDGGSQNSVVSIVTKSPEKISASAPSAPISIVQIDTKSPTYTTDQNTTSVEPEDRLVTAAVESESLPESCEPGPSLLEAPNISSSQEEVPDSLETNEPASDVGDTASNMDAPAICEANEQAVEGVTENMEVKSDSDTSPTIQTDRRPGNEETAENTSGDTIQNPKVLDVETIEESCPPETAGKDEKEEARESSKVVEGEGESLKEVTTASPDAGENQSVSGKKEEEKETVTGTEDKDEASKPIPADTEDSNKTCIEEGMAPEQGNKTAPEESPVRAVKDMLAVPVTPTNTAGTAETLVASPKTTPGGILKHVSQFDTPTSTAGRGRRVQFASSPVVFQPTRNEEEGFKTPKHSRSKSALSSRRTLLKADSTSKSPQTQKSQKASSEPVYPSLAGCDSPVEDILPVLSPCRFTHGLVHLVHARNIRTVGNISSLSEQEVQTLPIKSPKVENLRQALRNFQHHLGTKRRASLDSDSLGPPAKKRSRESGPEEVETNTNQQLSSSDQQLASSDQQQPVSDQQLPSSDQQLASSDQQQPPSDQQLPPSDQELPLSDQQQPPSDQQLPSSDQQQPLEPQQPELPPESISETREDNEDSQLSLVPSQSSQSEPAVVLSSPSDNNRMDTENDKGEPLQSAEAMEDDNVFVEEAQNITSDISQHVTDISTIEYKSDMEDEEDDTIETGSALEKSCPSPPMGVGSPEIPLQSSPSESPLSGTFDQFTDEKSGMSVQESLSSESESEGEREVEMELGETATTATSRSVASNEDSTSLHHDHSYFSSTISESKTSSVVVTATESVAVVPSAELVDHDYCSGPGSASSDQPQPLPPPSSDSSTSDQCPTELRSKLSSDIQDHNYCRQLLPSPPGATPDRVPEPEAVGNIDQNDATDDANNLASQELFSQNDDSVSNNSPLTDKQRNQPLLKDIGCQTAYSIDTGEQSISTLTSTNSSIPSDGDIESSLRTYVDGLLGRDDLPVATLWKLHQQLMCSLFKVSEKLHAESS